MAVLLSVDSAAPAVDGTFLVVEATRSLSPGRLVADDNLFRLMNVFNFDDDPFVFTAQYLAHFGAPIAGHVLFVRLRWVSSTGIPSPTRIFRILIT